MLFGNDVRAFAAAIQLDSKHVARILLGEIAVTPEVLAQVVAFTDVRFEWLLLGDGDMRSAHATADVDLSLHLPLRLESSFPVFETQTAAWPLTQIMPPEVVDAPATASETHVLAAKAVHCARSADSNVLLFIGAEAIYAGAGIVAAEWLRKRYATAAATTGAGLLADIEMTRPDTPPDLNHVARLAAAQGIGYGEATGRWAFAPKDNKARSLFHAAYSLGLPATAHVELGELRAHTGPAVRGAELGAAIGAATYVDLLIFAEQVRQLCATQNGVVLLIGNAMRGLHMFLQARATACGAAAGPFTVVSIDNHVQSDFHNYVRSHGGTSYKLDGAYRANLITLLHTCDAVFSGTNSYDNCTTTENISHD